MKYFSSFLLFLFLISFNLFSQLTEKEPLCKPKQEWCALEVQKPKINWSGYVQFYPYLDTRQTYGFRDGHFLLYPYPYLPSVTGKDINSRSQYYISPIQSRLKISASGVDVFEAQAASVIEFDFFGPQEIQTESARLRYAFITLDWEEKQVSTLLGQYWHPLCPEDHFPKTIDFNGGAPMAIALRSPHAKVSRRWNDTELMAALTAERDDLSNGPLGPSAIYSRNAINPGVNGHIRQYWGENNLFAFAFAYKRLVPQLQTEDDYKTTEAVNGYVVMGYTRFMHNNFTLNSNIAYSENANNPYFFGGYGVATRDSVTGCETYTRFKDVAWWLDMYHKDRCFTAGLFVGIIKDLGSTKPLYKNPETDKPILYFFPSSEYIDYVWRVAPRVLWNVQPMQFCLELEMTGACYGDRSFQNGKIINGKMVTDYRLLGAIYYYF